MLTHKKNKLVPTSYELTTLFPAPELGRDRDLAPPLALLPLLGDGPLPLGLKDPSESHLSNSSLTNFSICSLFISSLVPSDFEQKCM